MIASDVIMIIYTTYKLHLLQRCNPKTSNKTLIQILIIPNTSVDNAQELGFTSLAQKKNTQ